MKLYILRAVKYFISLSILLIVIFAFMFYTGSSSFETLLSVKGGLLLGAVLVLSMLYPYFGYTTRTVKCKIDEDRITRVFELCQYKLEQKTEQGELIFRTASIIKRFSTLGEDKISVKLEENQFIISGIRKDTVTIEYRLRTFLKNNEI